MIGGTTFVDANRNKVFDASESVITNVSIQLLSTKSKRVSSVKSDSEGCWTLTAPKVGSSKLKIV